MFLSHKLPLQDNLLRALKNGAWLTFDKLTRGVANFIVGVCVARYLGPDQFGLLSYVLAYLAFFQVFANLGLDSIVVRELVHGQDGPKKRIGSLLGTTLLMRFVAGFASWCFAVFFMVINYGWDDQRVLLVALAGGSLIFQAADTVDLWFQSQNASRRTVLAKLFAFSISAGLKLFLIYIGAALEFFAAAIFFEFGMIALSLALVYRRNTSESAWKSDLKEFGIKILRESWPIILSGFAISIYMRIDQLMIQSMLGNKEVAFFSAAFTFVSLWSIIPTIICSSFMPMISKYKSSNESMYLLLVSRVLRFLLMISISISILVMIWSKQIVYIIYGVEYADASGVLKILIFTIIPIFLGLGQGLWIFNEKKSSLYLKQTVIGLSFSIPLNFILIKYYGIQGAAISAVIAHSTSAILVNFFLERKLFFLQFSIPHKVQIKK